MSFRNSLLVAFLLFTTCYALGDSYANPENITFTGPNSIVLTEGDTGTMTFTVTFQGDAGVLYITLLNIEITFGAVTGDLTDVPSLLSFSAGTCGSTLSVASSCTQVLTIHTPNGAGETDADSGTQQFSAEQLYSTPTGGSITPYASSSADFSVTVNDMPPAVPEPSSLILLGSGLAVFAGALRRRLQDR